MAILTAPDFTRATGIAPTGTDLAALESIVSDVSDAIVGMAGNTFERATHTVVLDAPWNAKELELPARPVASITSLYLNWSAKGDPALFDATHLLTPYTDYRLPIDDLTNAVNKRGRVRMLSRAYWAFWQERTLTMPMSNRYADAPGAVKVTFVSGYNPLPGNLTRAAVMAATLMYNQRRTGVPVTSSSWNGRSVSYDGAYTATSALKSPAVWDLLSPFINRLAFA